MADGRVTIDTELDGKGLQTGLGKLKSGVKTGFKAAGIAITAASTAIGVLVKKSVQAYAQFEQLEGGIKTLFGTNELTLQEFAKKSGQSVSAVKKQYDELKAAENLVFKNAENAWKTAGVSANQYMEQVSSFAASLKQSLGGDAVAAAKAADTAIIDMSDNANKMGTNIQMIQNAYQGFAKQNYTMLDNLKLGYGGTKTEMERLLSDAEKLSGKSYDISNLSDVIEAIHVIQEDLGITGTTAKEASQTIEGSMNQMTAAWANLVVGIADPEANFDQLIDNFVQSASTFGKNIIPVIEKSIQGVGDLVEQLGPIIAKKLPKVIADISPGLIEAGAGMILNLVDGIIKAAPALLESLTGIVMSLTKSLQNTLPQMIDGLVSALSSMASSLVTVLPELIPQVVGLIMEIGTRLLDKIPELINVGIQLATALVQGVVDSIPVIIDYIPQLIDAVIAALIALLPQLLMAAIQLFMAIVQALPKIAIMLIANMPQIIKAIVTGLISGFAAIGQTGVQLMRYLWSGIRSMIGTLGSKVKQIPKKIKSTLKSGLSGLASIGANVVTGLWNGISNKVSWLKSKISGFVGNVKSWLKKFFKIGSPSKLMRDEIGQWIPAGIAEGITDETKAVTDAAEKQVKKIMDVYRIDDIDSNIKAANLSSIPINVIETGVSDSSLLTSAIDKLSSQNSDASQTRLLDAIKTALSDVKVINEMNVDGKTIATSTASFIQAELDKMQARQNRKLGYV